MCESVRPAQPVGPLNAAELEQEVDGIRPSGYLPIGQALRATAEALPAECPRSNVLSLILLQRKRKAAAPTPQ
ncbi:hypothetical protein [Saccharopolyspora spinosa]|nr:hypothetical protein [Saccharopolyspora spinosa]